MSRIAVLTLFLVGCANRAVSPPSAANCVEFDHLTNRHGVATACRMVWCQEGVLSSDLTVHNTGGVATLWCEPVLVDGGLEKVTQ